MSTTSIPSFFKTAAIGALFIFSLAISGCGEDEYPMEKAGKKVDKNMEETGDSMKEMGDKTDETMDKPVGQY